MTSKNKEQETKDNLKNIHFAVARKKEEKTFATCGVDKFI